MLLPGLLLALATGLRGWTAVAVAPLLTFVLVTIAIVVSGALDLRWTPPTVGVIAAVVVVLAAAAGRLRRSRRPSGDQPRHRRSRGAGSTAVPADAQSRLWSALAAAGVVAGAAIGMVTVLRGTGGLRTPNQGFDALFHVNAVEMITDAGTADPGITGTLNGYPAGTSVYPDALHALASLLMQLHGDSLAAINGLMACIPLIAGLGLVALLRSWGLVREAAVVPVVLAATTGFPTDPIWLGPIWVFAFAIAFVPAFLVLLTRALADRSVSATVVLGASAAALAMLHPSAAVSAAVFGVFLLASRWRGGRDVLVRDLLVLAPAAVLAAAVTLPLIGKALVDSGGGTIVDWPVAQSAGEAIGELALYNYGTTYPQLWLAVPALLGLVVGWRTRRVRWWYGGTAAFALLCVLAASYEGRLVQLLTGPWWNDRFRFEALVFLALAVFGAIGLVFLGDLVGQGLSRVGRRWTSARARPVPAAAGLALVLVLLGVLSQGFYIDKNVQRLEIAYVPRRGWLGGAGGPGRLRVPPPGRPGTDRCSTTRTTARRGCGPWPGCVRCSVRP